MIRKVVVPSAGIGTRLLPATKEQPKEMLPIFARGEDDRLCLKPLLQIVFESLHFAGFREFYFITGKTKRSIEDFFTIDNSFLLELESRNRSDAVKELAAFYDRIRKSDIVFINQPEPKGFGDAVYRAKLSTGSEAFLVHAGDDIIVSKEARYGTRSLSNLIHVFESKNATAAFCVEQVRDPSKYGVMVGEKVENGLYRVKRVVEKPSNPPSNNAIVALYVFGPKIYEALENTPPDKNKEVQLTNAIQKLIDDDYPVYALELDSSEKRIDIGDPASYLTALNSMAVKARETTTDD